MWLFTTYGFFSAVCSREGDGSHGQPVDPNTIQVRARVREHLEAIQDRFHEKLGNCEIFENSGTDYKYRIYVDKVTWSEVMGGLVGDIDYDNFKNEVRQVQGATEYEEALHEVWGVMFGMQR